MEGKFQDQGQLDQDLEAWFSPRGNQPDRCFLSEYEKQESIQIEDSAPEGSTIIKKAPEGGIYNMVVVKWSDNMEGQGYNMYAPLCRRLCKEE